MAVDQSYDYSDPQQNPEDAIRQRVMQQLAQEPPAPSQTAEAAPTTPSPDFGAAPAAATPMASPFLPGSNVTAATLPAASAASQPSDSGGTLNVTPGYTAPAPGPNASAPRPNVDASVVYTDPHGNAYDPPALATAFANGTITDPRVRDILAQYGYGSGATAVQKTAAQGAGTTGGAGTAGGGGTAGAAGAYGLTNGYAAPPADTSWRDSIRQIIMNRLNADQGPIDINSPQISSALTAAKDTLSRQSDTERNQLAERLYAQGGLNTNAVNQGVQQSNERQGTALSSLRANLIMSQYKDRATELNHLLDLATQTGDTEQAQKIQLTLSNLQAALQREGLGVNLAEFGAQLNQNSALYGLN